VPDRKGTGGTLPGLLMLRLADAPMAIPASGDTNTSSRSVERIVDERTPEIDSMRPLSVNW